MQDTSPHHYTLATRIAGEIHRESYSGVGLSDVMLFGSTLNAPEPRDIDILLIHGGRAFEPYSKYHGWKPDVPLQDQGDANVTSESLLIGLGYRDEDEDENQTSALVKEIVEGIIAPSTINDVLDVNVLHVGLLTVDEYWDDVRQQAIDDCKDSTFWYTVLSTGRIYDVNTGDFTITTAEKYPVALSLFPSEK